MRDVGPAQDAARPSKQQGQSTRILSPGIVASPHAHGQLLKPSRDHQERDSIIASPSRWQQLRHSLGANEPSSLLSPGKPAWPPMSEAAPSSPGMAVLPQPGATWRAPTQGTCAADKLQRCWVLMNTHMPLRHTPSALNSPSQALAICIPNTLPANVSAGTQWSLQPWMPHLLPAPG